ncbi:UDP-glucose 4-epimerase [Thamnocephalis sphaerospora]|uniref:UDP-glucose 4-epimerase n=1 Tax=Thamnocephalis sphaerospora TaxID=78915 RepID=A0A4P9XQ61_9FUNG|nr:UDP-glucose 4-epimerase [Thamnocephalis sphaerospora]|eukprot:RKP07410.1 UDP-glucose 4-epimerase [Thamnocephalis sphaerospora]
MAVKPAQTILVTGGAGFIGSHTCVELLLAGYEVVVVDNLANASTESLRRVEHITGRPLHFYEVDILDRPALEEVFAAHPRIYAVIHFAGLKAVGESASMPLRYYEVNVVGAQVLLQCMDAAGVKRLVFSSSAVVYGLPETSPVPETAATNPTNPYGRTKLFIEHIIRDHCAADRNWQAVMLRYFNPIGAHPSGEIGEDPRGVPNNLAPYVCQTILGLREKLRIFGGDYATADGTGVRDFIHVVDLAKSHLAALRRLEDAPGCLECNVGSGVGYSVLELVHAMEHVSGKKVRYEIAARRPGDLACVVADTRRAERELGWRAQHDLETMCRDMWRWQQKNPQGYS